MTATGEALQRAANLIREHGWTQDDYVGTNGRLCAWQAIFLATAPRSMDAALQSVHRELLLRGWQHGIIAWNDADGRTVDEVLELLEG